MDDIQNNRKEAGHMELNDYITFQASELLRTANAYKKGDDPMSLVVTMQEIGNKLIQAIEGH